LTSQPQHVFQLPWDSLPCFLQVRHFRTCEVHSPLLGGWVG
jgi:hypothetical protein